MAVSPALQDWVLRELVTSVKMNQQVRDVHRNSFPYLATEVGSIPYLLGTREVGILAPPSEERVLISSGGAPSWKTINGIIVPDTISTDMIKDGAVTEPKLAADNQPVSGRVLQSHGTNEMRWQAVSIQEVKFATVHVPNPGRDDISSYTWTATRADWDSFEAFYAVVYYPQQAWVFRGDRLDPVRQHGPIMYRSLKSGSNYPTGGGKYASIDGMEITINGNSISWRVKYQPARRSIGGIRIGTNMDFYGIRNQVF